MKNIIFRLYNFIFITILFILPFKSHTQEIDYFSATDSIQEWINIRVTAAKNNIQEKVEMPFVVRTVGWGCMCPDNYIGISPNVAEGPWISPIAPENFPKVDTIGYSLIVTGYFTGEMTELDLRFEDGEPEEWLYIMPEFVIESWRENDMDYDVFFPRIIEE